MICYFNAVYYSKGESTYSKTLLEETIESGENNLSEKKVNSDLDLHDYNDEIPLQDMDNVLRKDIISSVMMPRVSVKAHGLSSSTLSAEAIQCYRVSGCSIPGVNGRYLEWGSTCDALRFRNAKGWIIFRHSFKEIPDLNIFIENCYNAFDGPSIADLQEMKAGRI